MRCQTLSRKTSRIVLQTALTEAATSPAKAIPGQPAQGNVIVLMTDGTGAAHTTITRWYKGGPLALDRMYYSLVRTHSAESLITDSAPAATAFATGYKSNDQYVGIYPAEITLPGLPPLKEDWKYRPLATVLEAAKAAGKSVGLVATSNIQHASPAAYSAHVPDRGDFNEIALPAGRGGQRKDGEDLIRVLQDRGYTFIETRDQLLNLPRQTRRVWGLFAEDDLAYDFDRPHLAPTQPSLAEMTQKAIEILSRNPKGFFLFVEASKVDWASHGNDPIGVISDLLAFDGAVASALDFAKTCPRTLVLAFSDHGNGGMSLGNRKTDKSYSKLPLAALVNPLKKAKLTGEGVEIKLGDDLSEANIRSVLAEFYGIDDLTAEEVAAVQKRKKRFLNDQIGPMLSRRSAIGWTTHGHGGEDLTVYYYGLNRPLPLLDNTDLAKLCARHLGLDLERSRRDLFLAADEAFPALGATVAIDDSDPANRVLVVTKGPKTARLPFSKNVLLIGDREYRLQGLTVPADRAYGGRGRVYVPRQAVEIFRHLVRK
ncbi:MAG: alkaline phosphatase [Desulfobacterota bacterium]|nr:alkaline phosphatase [Thermodesulfobacteriota bacterium]